MNKDELWISFFVGFVQPVNRLIFFVERSVEERYHKRRNVVLLARLQKFVENRLRFIFSAGTGVSVSQRRQYVRIVRRGDQLLPAFINRSFVSALPLISLRE